MHQEIDLVPFLLVWWKTRPDNKDDFLNMSIAMHWLNKWQLHVRCFLPHSNVQTHQTVNPPTPPLISAVFCKPPTRQAEVVGGSTFQSPYHVVKQRHPLFPAEFRTCKPEKPPTHQLGGVGGSIFFCVHNKLFFIRFSSIKIPQQVVVQIIPRH